MATVGSLLAANNGDGNGNGNGSEVGIGALPSFELEPSPEPTYEGSTEEGNLSNDMTDDDVTMSPTSNRGQFSPPSMKPPSNGFTTHPTSFPPIFPESYYSPPSPISRPSKTTSFRPTPSIISNSPTRLHSNSNHSSNWQTNITTNINTTANATSDTTAYTSSNYSTRQ
mmetsp:Transcript_21462/g.44628  ORF Transcript_21462/g.44628 Transcript_21462/m.44628 type:complete len:169 (+) Transcript_21462:1051-1557(+)